jgi:hypothetical protein
VIATGFGSEAAQRPAPPVAGRRAAAPEPQGTPVERPPSFDADDLDIPPFIRQSDE